MERIQSALAKARATREGRPAPGPGPVQRRRPAASDDAKRAVWSELRRVELSPRRLRQNRIVAFESSAAAAEFDRLRTRAMQRMEAEKWRRIAVISPTSQNGKTTVAANLAFSLARQVHLDAMLMEFDLRRPSLVRMLGLSRDLDLSRALTGDGAFADHAVRVQDNLIVAPSQPVHGGAAELLQAPAARSVLQQIDAAYAPAVAIFDMPPLDVGDDAIGSLAHADCALIVAAAGRTTIAQIDACEREVASRVPVLGVVLNKCRYERETNDAYGYY